MKNSVLETHKYNLLPRERELLPHHPSKSSQASCMALSPSLSERKIVSSFWNTDRLFVKIEERESLLLTTLWKNKMFERQVNYFYLWLLSSSLVHLERHCLVFLKRYNWLKYREWRSWNWTVFLNKRAKERERKNLERHCLVFLKRYNWLKYREGRSWNWTVFLNKRAKKEREKKPWTVMSCFSAKVQAVKERRSWNGIVFSTKLINWPVERNLISF